MVLSLSCCRLEAQSRFDDANNIASTALCSAVAVPSETPLAEFHLYRSAGDGEVDVAARDFAPGHFQGLAVGVELAAVFQRFGASNGLPLRRRLVIDDEPASVGLRKQVHQSCAPVAEFVVERHFYCNTRRRDAIGNERFESPHLQCELVLQAMIDVDGGNMRQIAQKRRERGGRVDLARHDMRRIRRGHPNVPRRSDVRQDARARSGWLGTNAGTALESAQSHVIRGHPVALAGLVAVVVSFGQFQQPHNELVDFG